MKQERHSSKVFQFVSQTKGFANPFQPYNQFIQSFRDILFSKLHADQVAAYGASYWSVASLNHEITVLIELFFYVLLCFRSIYPFTSDCFPAVLAAVPFKTLKDGNYGANRFISTEDFTGFASCRLSLLCCSLYLQIVRPP